MPDRVLLNFLGRFDEFGNLGALRGAAGDRGTMKFLDESLDGPLGGRVDGIVGAFSGQSGRALRDVPEDLPSWQSAEALDFAQSTSSFKQVRFDFVLDDVQSAVRARANLLAPADRDFILGKLADADWKSYRIADSADNPRGTTGAFREVKHGKTACNKVWHEVFVDFFLNQQPGNSGSWHIYSGGDTGRHCQNANFYRLMNLMEVPYTIHFLT